MLVGVLATRGLRLRRTVSLIVLVQCGVKISYEKGPARSGREYSGREERVFLPQILADISLAKDDDAGRIETPCFSGRACSDAEALSGVSLSNILVQELLKH